MTRELLADLEVNGMHVRIEKIVDADGGTAIELSGLDCDLVGEMPCLYYPTPIRCVMCDEPTAQPVVDAAGDRFCPDCWTDHNENSGG